MSTSKRHGAGSRWTMPRTPAAGRSAAPAGDTTAAPAERPGPRLPSEAVRQQLHAASVTLRAAFVEFADPAAALSAARARPAAPAPRPAAPPRIANTAGASSGIQTTVRVNTQTSTVRASSARIGLKATPARSRLYSSPLGLDVTSREAPSTLSSTMALGLNVVDAPSTITSVARMNGARRSLGCWSAGFQDSTSVLEISGAYAGNATALTFKVTNATPVTLGMRAAHVALRIVDHLGRLVDAHSGYVAAGQVIDLASIGLKVRFTPGTLSADAVTVPVVPVAADVVTSAPFNASWGTAPLFENFGRVTAGSFVLNGFSIPVYASDSIDSVLARIDESGAGVRGTVAGDKVQLSTKEGSESDILLRNDTSGFFAATHLASATTVRGNIRDDQQPFSQTSQFSSVTSGSFTVNGALITIDRSRDSLSKVLERINSTDTGVTAAYDVSAHKLVFATRGNSRDAITLSDDTTGFVSAARLATAVTVPGRVREDRQVLAKLARFVAVSDGSFEVNGATIEISVRRDSVSSIVRKINEAHAGVVAAFNERANRIELESLDDSESGISIGGDSTAFLSIAGLRAANTVVGSVPDDLKPLRRTAPFARVRPGAFEVNGVHIPVDPDADSLRDIIARVNGSRCGAAASYEAEADRLVFTPSAVGAILSLKNDSAGFLAAARVATGVAGTRADVDAPFDSSVRHGPLFDPGFAVTAGSFSVNGVRIPVSASDSVSSVLARITASDAAVTAAFDPETQLVTLTSKHHAPAPIVLGDDTSGFLAAVKLDVSTLRTTGAASVKHGEAPMPAAADALPQPVVSTAGELVDAAAAGAAELSRTLTQIATERQGNEPFVTAIVNAASDAVAALRDGGAAGFTVGGWGAEVRLNVDRDALARSIEAAHDRRALAAAVVAALDDFMDRVASTVSSAHLQGSGAARTAPASAGPLTPRQSAAAAALLKKRLAPLIRTS